MGVQERALHLEAGKNHGHLQSLERGCTMPLEACFGIALLNNVNYRTAGPFSGLSYQTIMVIARQFRLKVHEGGKE